MKVIIAVSLANVLAFILIVPLAKAELPLGQEDPLVRSAKAQIVCSSIFIRAFPGEDKIAELGSEIVEDAMALLSLSDVVLSTKEIVVLARDGVEMWDKSREQGRIDMLRMCGSDLLKKEIEDDHFHRPDPDDELYM